MLGTAIQSTFVAAVAPVGIADAADAARGLTGTEIRAGRASLQIKRRIAADVPGAVSYEGVLRTGSLLIPSAKVDVVLSPWSASRTEVGLRPVSRIGIHGGDTLRSRRFFTAAWAVIDELIENITASQSIEVAAASLLKVAA